MNSTTRIPLNLRDIIPIDDSLPSPRQTASSTVKYTPQSVVTHKKTTSAIKKQDNFFKWFLYPLLG